MADNIFENYTMDPCPKCSFPLLKDGTCSHCDRSSDSDGIMDELRRRQEEDFRRGGPFGDGRL